ncbi:VOC family protein [Ferrovibrio sp.]|uniref:VOC family protein n=1 Tax=Ferrovibrio sp. TaxID=1917215 RepID=UPI003516D548
MIDHISIAVRDLAVSSRFYDAVLAPLGLTRLAERPATIGYGKRYPEFWLNLRPQMIPAVEGTGAHVCLRAADADAVSAFHDRALQHGGRSDGAPGPRQAAMTTYFAAFILDPDGNKIEAASFPGPAG